MRARTRDPWFISPRRLVVSSLGLFLSLHAGCVDSHCYDDLDCPSGKTCNRQSGACVYPCTVDQDCTTGFACIDHECKPGLDAGSAVAPLVCPEDMVPVANLFCVDRYEASRPDATETKMGQDLSRAVSVEGVVPWNVADNASAEAACIASAKRLCTSDEWLLACEGPDGTVYSYGDVYEPTTCNGIDAFGGGSFRVAPTGWFPSCTNEWGVFDINGNMWEHVAGGNDMLVRGGAFNCMDSAALHKCRYVPGNWTPSARGFRCCLTPDRQPARDAGTDLGASLPDAPTPDDELPEVPGRDKAGPDSVAGAPDLPTTADAVAGEGPQCVPEEDAREPGEVERPVDVSSGSPDSSALSDGPPDGADTSGGASPFPCPADMALSGAVCVDRYEASRPDATSTSAGSDESRAASVAGVLPWYVNPMTPAALAAFEAACEAAGKRLCGPEEWLDLCRGPTQTTYFFGNIWDPAVCNSVDSYCQKCCDALGDVASCPTGENCGYSSLLSSSYTPETCGVAQPYSRDSCHVCFHVMPTGSFPGCRNDAGIYDVNGNVWEVVPVPTSVDGRGYQVRGGAFNCGSPSARFQCDFTASWTDLYAGFRCCTEVAR
jgi:sulfatase modifying factor 1